MRTRVQQAVNVELLCVILFAVLITPLIATQTEKLAQTITTPEPFHVAIPVGEYVALLENQIVLSPPLSLNRSYYILLSNIGWILKGDVDGGSINIHVLNNSNYQDFVSGRQYSVLQQVYNVSGLFVLHVTLPNNGPNGTFIPEPLNATYYRWFIFDNKPGLSTGLFDARLSVGSIIDTGSIRFVYL